MANIPPRPSPLGANVCIPPPPAYNNNNRDRRTTNEVINTVYGDYYDFKGARNGPVIHHHYHGGDSPPQSNYNYHQGRRSNSYNRPNNTYQQPEWQTTRPRGNGLDCSSSPSPTNVLPSYSSIDSTRDTSTLRPNSSLQAEDGDRDVDWDSDIEDSTDLYSAGLTTYHRKD